MDMYLIKALRRLGYTDDEIDEILKSDPEEVDWI